MRIALYLSSSHPYLYNYPIFTSLLLPELVHLLPCLLSHTTCSPVYSSTCQLATLLPELVHLLPCLLSQATCSPVNSSTCQLATLPCLLSHTTCSPVYSSTCQLAMLLPELVHLLPCCHLYHKDPCPNGGLNHSAVVIRRAKIREYGKR